MVNEFEKDVRSAQTGERDLASFVGSDRQPKGIESQQTCEESQQRICDLDVGKETAHPMPPRFINRALLLIAVFLGFFGGFRLWVLGGLRMAHNERFGKLAARTGMFLCLGSLVALFGLVGCLEGVSLSRPRSRQR